MKLVRLVGVGLVTAALGAAEGCGPKSHEPGHAAESATPAPPPPTPDTTPIEALRTPAGLVLKLGEETTPAPTPEPTPSSSRSE